jgi:hypothetical protein
LESESLPGTSAASSARGCVIRPPQGCSSGAFKLSGVTVYAASRSESDARALRVRVRVCGGDSDARRIRLGCPTRMSTRMAPGPCRLSERPSSRSEPQPPAGLVRRRRHGAWPGRSPATVTVTSAAHVGGARRRPGVTRAGTGRAKARASPAGPRGGPESSLRVPVRPRRRPLRPRLAPSWRPSESSDTLGPVLAGVRRGGHWQAPHWQLPQSSWQFRRPARGTSGARTSGPIAARGWCRTPSRTQLDKAASDSEQTRTRTRRSPVPRRPAGPRSGGSLRLRQLDSAGGPAPGLGSRIIGWSRVVRSR